MQTKKIRFGVTCFILVSLITFAQSSPFVHAKVLPTINPNSEVVVRSKSGNKVNHAGFKKIGQTKYYTSTLANAKKYQSQDNLTIQPNYVYKPTMTVDDTLEPQGYMTLLDSQSTWDVSTGDSSMIIADIDTGFTLNHEDLVNKWYTNSGEVGAGKETNGIDDDGNGFIDDWRGWDFAHDDNDPSAGTDNVNGTAVEHGTEVSGLISASSNNAKGVASLDWGAKLLPLQIFTDDGSATTADLANAMDYAINVANANVINLSLGSASTDPTIESLLAEAQSLNIVVVASAGNCGGADYASNGCSYQGQTTFPATDPNTIAVAATDLSDNRASFSSQGTALDVSAPGSGAILSPTYNSSGGTTTYSSTSSGTSFSSPITASIVGLIRSVWSTATNDEVRDMLVDTAINVTGMSGNAFSTNYGFGRVAPLAAVNRANLCKTAVFSADINCDGNVDILDLSNLAYTWNLDNTGRSDTNDSGKTDILDLSTLASQWGN